MLGIAEGAVRTLRTRAADGPLGLLRLLGCGNQTGGVFRE